MNSAFTFFGGLADMFLSIMIWFIFESQKSPTVIFDGNRVYVVDQVVSGRNSGLNEDCQTYDEPVSCENGEYDEQEFVNTSDISRRMIE